MRDEPPGPVDLTAGRRSGLRNRPGVHVRRRDLGTDDLVRSRGLLLTGRPLTALETSIAVPEGSVFLDRALQKHVRFDDVYAAYYRNIGAHGFSQIATLLTAAADRADSAAERLMLGLLRRAGLTGWAHGHPFPSTCWARSTQTWPRPLQRHDRQFGAAAARSGRERTETVISCGGRRCGPSRPAGRSS